MTDPEQVTHLCDSRPYSYDDDVVVVLHCDARLCRARGKVWDTLCEGGHGDVVEVSRTVRDVMMAVGGPGNANPVAFVEGRLG